MAAETTGKTIGVTLAVSLVAAIMVSTAAVQLTPIQERNKAKDKKRNVLIAADLYKEGVNVNKVFVENIEARVVNLQKAEKAKGKDPKNYSARKAVKDPETSVAIPKEKNDVGIMRRAKYKTVYLIREKGKDEIKKIILPMHGKGLWSTMYGFLAVGGPNLNTVKGITFYDHGETPGLGGEIVNPSWQKLWVGKKIYNEAGEPKLQVIKGKVSANTKNKKYKIDGISGATLTINGVTATIRYWMDSHGYKPFLQKMKEKMKGGKDE